jgi:hypothetical protein
LPCDCLAEFFLPHLRKLFPQVFQVLAYRSMAAPLYITDSGLLFHAGKILVLTVGLPARGKTHIARALERYLRWMGVKTQVVSLGDHRRKTVGGAQQLPPDYFSLGMCVAGLWMKIYIKTLSKI